ncbi:MAG: hypothetical protein HY078_11440 [Elusimicrobia bacterium]|nr:hypothetical protein [Elusimicrobiota bacterium]
MRRFARLTAALLAPLLLAAASPRLEYRDAPRPKAPVKKRARKPRIGPHVFVGTKLDLPLTESLMRAAVPGYSLFSEFGGPTGYGGADIAYGIGLWGTSYFAKRELDDRIQNKTLTAPIWRQQDVTLMLLLPIEDAANGLQHGDFRTRPVGGILRLGLFGSSPDKPAER